MPQYMAERRVRITLPDGSSPAEAFHEADDSDMPRCNIRLRPFRGQATMFQQVGSGFVTCGNCSRCAS